MEEDGWDLLAVVRGCRLSGSAAAAAEVGDPFSSFPSAVVKEEPAVGGDRFDFPELWGSGSGLEELDELSKAFFSEPRQQPLIFPSPSSPAAVSAAAAAPALPELPRKQRGPHRPPSQMSRSKRRKNQQKRVVCHVPADGLSSDVWAWRKYGQKPIKGSPYPRGYYRCSSSKGCPARKQLERSRTDPGVFIITYTAEHNHPAPTHRNSLAGSTRTKFPSPTSAAAPAGSGSSDRPPLPPSPLSSPTAAGLSPTTPLTAAMEDELLGPRRGTEDGGATEEDEEGSLMVEDMEVMGEDELVFMGFDDLGLSDSTAAAAGGFEDHLFSPPWLSTGAANTAAAGGGR